MKVRRQPSPRTQPARARVPEVNLLPPSERRLILPGWLKQPETVVAAIAVVTWTLTGLAIAIILGWRPHLGLGI